MEGLKEILSNFEGKKIVIVGDVMLDRYLEGNVFRINPEAPVPIVSLRKEYNELGGAANASSNIASLGGKAVLFSFVGKDENANILRTLLDKQKITHFLCEKKLTTEKVRILGEGQQLLRYDNEETSEKSFDERTKRELLKECEEAAIILISDYAKGTITEDLMEMLGSFKNKMVIDPKPKNMQAYSGAYLITPNEKESYDMSSCSDVGMAGNFLKKELNSNILITRGKKGMMLFSDNNAEIPTHTKEIYDVTGAGDTAVSTLVLSLAAGASLREAAIISNHAAGIAVSKKGTYSVSLNELSNKITSDEKKIVGIEELKKNIEDLKRKNNKIIWTNGCFDLLHVGHVRYLRNAKKLGDVLVVGINSDNSVRKLKGEDRPIQSEKERAEILSSLEFIDKVIIFPELSVENYLSLLKPDVYVKGGDYDLSSINQDERKAVENYGGKISMVSLMEGKSSSKLIEKVNKQK